MLKPLKQPRQRQLVLARSKTAEQNSQTQLPVARTQQATTQAQLAREHMTQQQMLSQDSAESAQADHDQINYAEASLAVEAAISIVINGIHYAVLMASPSELEYLAIGFLYSEGLIDHSHELLDWEVTYLNSASDLQQFTDSNAKDSTAVEHDLLQQLQDYDAYVVSITLNQRCHQRIQSQRRQLAGRTGCGMCGMIGLTQALPDLSGYQQSVGARPSLAYLLRMREQIDRAQKTHQLTGAVHAAAAIYQGQLYLFEDVGRHNALDKLIGWQLRHKVMAECVVMTSRLSIELVQKAVRCRIPWLVGMSAPTSTAVRVAQRYGLGLAGFLRDNRVTFYC
ncbi:formate dehydrogenase accessory sulfurtransferase FdhD [Psychrobacter lutiphocae]|uniref:formate dehydrogenase accessory sulfurtransferase FdhD n=1 Tax=Psychrobacter lutiphocae TaxID=540500 RepID=UPI001D118BF0|nr:formate dehydrogenase accessory sulfurtransferase FdhD [Psychrobacter lutiphocae]